MSVSVIHGIIDLRMFIISFGQQDGGAYVYRMSPKLGKQLAFKFLAFHPLGIGREVNRRNLVGKAEPNGVACIRVKPDLLNLTVKVARRFVNLISDKLGID